MSRGPGGAAEIVKLAHQLGVARSRLEFLGTVDPVELRELRHQIGAALFAAGEHHFSMVVAVSKLLPCGLAARITEHALSPLIAARTAELLDPARAVDLVVRLSDGYLADVSVAMDPARAPEVLRKIPPERVATVAAELARRGEWVVMGAFASVVSLDALAAAVARLTGEQLLRVGFVLDDPDRLGVIGRMLTDVQIDELLAAAAEHELWHELDELAAHLDPSGAARLSARYAAAPRPVVAAVEAATAGGTLGSPALTTLERR